MSDERRPDLDLREQLAGGRRVDVSEASIGELVGNLGESTSRLLRQEVALAKAETRQEVASAGRGVGMLAAAGVAALLALIMVSMAAVDALSASMDPTGAYLVVFAGWVVIALGLVLAGRGALKSVTPVAERTQQTVKEIPDALRGRP